MGEDIVGLAERQVREAEERVARQSAIVNRLETAGLPCEAETARVLLEAMLASLGMARASLLVLRSWQDGGLDDR